MHIGDAGQELFKGFTWFARGSFNIKWHDIWLPLAHAAVLSDTSGGTSGFSGMCHKFYWYMPLSTHWKIGCPNDTAELDGFLIY